MNEAFLAKEEIRKEDRKRYAQYQRGTINEYQWMFISSFNKALIAYLQKKGEENGTS